MMVEMAPRVRPRTRQAGAGGSSHERAGQKSDFPTLFLSHYKRRQDQPAVTTRIDAVDQTEDQAALQSNPEECIEDHYKRSFP